jgi:hypothetical protein
MIASLHDGHGGAYAQSLEQATMFPLVPRWVDDVLVVIGTDAASVDKRAIGDVILSIDGRWNMHPLEPRWRMPVAFMTNSGAISYAESIMGIVEHYRLGEIVGSPTAGTNGNINPSTCRAASPSPGRGCRC